MALILEPLEERACPAPVLAHEQVVIVELVNNNPALTPMAQTLAQYALPVAGDYGVGAGSVVSVVTLPGASNDAQIKQELVTNIQAGVLPQPGSDTLYLVFGNQQLTDSWAQGFLGYHASFWLKNRLITYAVIQPDAGTLGVSIVTGHEMTEAAVDPYGGNPEVCDLFNGFYYNCHGYQAPFVQAPNGQPLVGVHTTQQQALDALPVEAFQDVVFTVLASVDPYAFAGLATWAKSIHNTNPMANTNEGRAYEWPGEIEAYQFLISLVNN